MLRKIRNQVAVSAWKVNNADIKSARDQKNWEPVFRPDRAHLKRAGGGDG
jgi:hypothetical protein